MPYKLTKAGRKIVFVFNSIFFTLLFSFLPLGLFVSPLVGVYFVINFAMFIVLVLQRVDEWEAVEEQETFWYSVLMTAAPVVATCAVSLKSLFSTKLIEPTEKLKRKEKQKNIFSIYNEQAQPILDEFDHIEQLRERVLAQYKIIEDAIEGGYLPSDSILDYLNEMEQEIVPLDTLVNKS